MFDSDFYPSPSEVIEEMMQGHNITGKTILEPSAGKGNIIDWLSQNGAGNVIACEKSTELTKILQTKCKVIANDFLTVASDQISHIDFIVMNPPFSEAEKHINHAFEIAPPGCKIIALCNTATLENDYSASRKKLTALIDQHGSSRKLGQCFEAAERKTGVNVSLINLEKPGTNYNTEFEGFFMDEEPEEINQTAGLMSYNVVRDLVNRYVAAVKLYDQQLTTGAQMNYLLSGFYGESLTFTCTEKGAPKLRNEFKKDLQKAGWKFIFEKMNLEKHSTKGLKEDINKFVEQQTQIPFTMKNIYKMLEIVIGTTSQRMDRALLEVFNWVTSHADDNKYNLPGWKTNSHYLLTKKFIVPNICWQDKFDAEYHPQDLKISYNGYAERMDDLVKALCYLTGDNYDNFKRLGYIDGVGSGLEYGKFFDWAFFTCKGYKKGTMHFEFKDAEIWGKFNQRIAKLKGYPLFEGKTQTAYQQRQTGRKPQASNSKPKVKPTILQTFNFS